MTLSTFTAHNVAHAYAELGPPAAADVPLVVWGHGWGRTHADFLPLARSLERSAHHILLDFPGFGESPQPSTAWTTNIYADALADWMRGVPASRRIFVGHSFGGRVGLRLGAQHPDAVDGMVLVAAHGLQRQRSAVEKARIFLRVRTFKMLKLLERLGVDMNARKERYGSADYRNAGTMRPIFVAVINEDQAETVKAIRCPVALIYGEKDTESPPEFGTRLSRLIPNTTLRIIPGLDHYTILTDGGPQVVHAVGQMIGG